MRDDLTLHCGGRPATFQELIEVPVPPRTDTYMPLPYADLVNLTREIATARLPHFQLMTEAYGLNKPGTQMFGVHRYHNPDDPGLQLAVGMRTSYDKSMATGLAMGASVFVCDNLAFYGSGVTVLRKHTGELMMKDLEDSIVRSVYAATGNYQQIQFDRDRLMQVEIDPKNAHHLMMLMFFKHEIISPTQLRDVYTNWEHPPHPEFEPRNLWSLYNAVNEPMKRNRAEILIEKHVKLHEVMVEVGREYMGPDWDTWEKPEQRQDFEFLAERVPA